MKSTMPLTITLDHNQPEHTASPRHINLSIGFPRFAPSLTQLAQLTNLLPNTSQHYSTPLAHNKFTLCNSFDAVSHIHDIPQHLFSQGYKFVSFDVISLFTNIPQRQTINIILNRLPHQNSFYHQQTTLPTNRWCFYGFSLSTHFTMNLNNK